MAWPSSTPWSCSPKASPGCPPPPEHRRHPGQHGCRPASSGPGRLSSATQAPRTSRGQIVQPQGPLPGVGKTALGVAMVRARESRRDDRLFDDPWAQAFVDAAPGAFPEEPKTTEEVAALGPMASLGAVFYAHGVIRTRFFDDYLTAATAARCSQVVLLAAGLDT